MRRFMLGLIVGLCIALPTCVIADSLVGSKIETVVKIKLDGEYLPVDAIGLKGTTYAPVRAFAEELGKEVEWVDGEVIITSKAMEEWTLEKVEAEIERIEFNIKAHEILIETKKSKSRLTDEEKNAMIEAQKVIDESLTRLEELKQKREELLNTQPTE
jgi:hypothetical protein